MKNIDLYEYIKIDEEILYYMEPYSDILNITLKKKKYS